VPLALAIISFCPIPTAIHAADSSSRIAAVVDRAVRPLLKAYDVPGIAVAATVTASDSTSATAWLRRRAIRR